MGDRLENRRHYKELEEKLKIAQRAYQPKRAKAIHAKLSQLLTQPKMVKSLLDSDWNMLKAMLEYKCAGTGVVFEEIDEKYTTQT